MDDRGPVDLSTRPRVPLRVLLRVSSTDAADDLATRFLELKVAVLGEAKKERWQELWQAGDLEAIAWVPAIEVNASIARLRSFPETVDARVSMRDVG